MSLANYFKTMVSTAIKSIGKLSSVGLKKGTHLTRYYYHQHLSQVLDAFGDDAIPKRVLSISGSNQLCELLKFKNMEVVETNFPEHNILNLSFPDGYFDFVLSDQVLEHVEGNPQKAIDETYRVLKTGGIAVLTTCFIQKIHGAPKDFWRFTPDALAYLFGNFSKIMDVGGCGNPWLLLLIMLDLEFLLVPHAKWHPLHKIATYSDKSYPIATWIVAKK